MTYFFGIFFALKIAMTFFQNLFCFGKSHDILFQNCVLLWKLPWHIFSEFFFAAEICSNDILFLILFCSRNSHDFFFGIVFCFTKSNEIFFQNCVLFRELPWHIFRNFFLLQKNVAMTFSSSDRTMTGLFLQCMSVVKDAIPLFAWSRYLSLFLPSEFFLLEFSHNITKLPVQRSFISGNRFKYKISFYAQWTRLDCLHRSSATSTLFTTVNFIGKLKFDDFLSDKTATVYLPCKDVGRSSAARITVEIRQF